MDTPKTLLTFLYIFLGLSASAQITFEKRYDYEFAEAAHDIQQTSDGGYILAGRQGIGIGASKILLIKTDSMGNEEWHKILGENDEQYAYAVLQTSDGGFILAGHTITDSTSFDMYLIKTDSQGGVEWTKTYGGTELDFASDLIYTEDGGYMLAGGTKSFSDDGNQDVYIVKVDSEGNFEWDNVYGGPDFEIGNSINNVSTGGFIIAGISERLDFNTQAYVIRTDSQGDTLWTKTYGWDKEELGLDIIETGIDEFIMVGYSANNSTLMNYHYDTYIIKLNSGGDTLWTKVYSNGLKEDGAVKIVDNGDETYAVLIVDYNDNEGDSPNSAVNLLQIDYEGNIKWQKEYDGEGADHGFALILTNDGGYAIAGLSDSNCGTCAFLIKTGLDGELITSLKPPLIQDFDLSIYPNPASEQFTIFFQLPEPGFLQIDLYDIHGRFIKPISKADRTTQQYKEQVNIEGLTSGFYLLRFLDSGGVVLTKKIIIQ